MVRPVMVWPRPSKMPVNVALRMPTGAKPALLFHVLVPEASMSAPRTYICWTCRHSSLAGRLPSCCPHRPGW